MLFGAKPRREGKVRKTVGFLKGRSPVSGGGCLGAAAPGFRPR